MTLSRELIACPACGGAGVFHGTNGRDWRCHSCRGTGRVYANARRVDSASDAVADRGLAELDAERDDALERDEP